MKELIVAGYEVPHVAFLARAVLSRQQTELSISDDDIALLSRESGDFITIREPVLFGQSPHSAKRFWRKLISLLFAPPGTVAEQAEHMNRLIALGIDSNALDQIISIVPNGATAVFVLVEHSTRDQLLNLLSGFQCKTLRIRLSAENPRAELQSLSKTG